jgi:hypothetical protein
MNKIRLSHASPRCAGYFWRAASPAVAIARGTSVFSQSANAATAPGRSRDGWQLRGPGRVHRHQYRPKRHQREPRREPGHSCDRVRPGTNGTVINGTVINRTVHAADASAASAQCALTTAYNDAAGRVKQLHRRLHRRRPDARARCLQCHVLAGSWPV